MGLQWLIISWGIPLVSSKLIVFTIPFFQSFCQFGSLYPLMKKALFAWKKASRILLFFFTLVVFVLFVQSMEGQVRVQEVQMA